MVETPVDVLIIGGGSTGAGIARDAALRGFRTALVDKSDFGAGTSSHSSRLIHGGIRYLEQRAFHLVFEASRERRVLLKIAPHLVRPLAFLFPVYRGGRLPAWKLRAGMWLYDLLSVFRNVHWHRWLRAKKVRRRSEEHTSELQSHSDLVCRLLLEKKNNQTNIATPNDSLARVPGGWLELY